MWVIFLISPMIFCAENPDNEERGPRHSLSLTNFHGEGTPGASASALRDKGERPPTIDEVATGTLATIKEEDERRSRSEEHTSELQSR